MQTCECPNAAAEPPAEHELCRVSFSCHAPEAAEVCLVGDFNGWQPAAHPMERMTGGDWRLRLDVSGGVHQYVFLVDGKPSLVQTCRAHGRRSGQRSR